MSLCASELNTVTNKLTMHMIIYKWAGKADHQNMQQSQCHLVIPKENLKTCSRFLKERCITFVRQILEYEFKA